MSTSSSIVLRQKITSREPTDIEQLFEYVIKLIQMSSNTPIVKWNVYVNFTSSKISSTTMIQILSVLIPSFNYIPGVTPSGPGPFPCIYFSDTPELTYNAKISIIRGKASAPLGEAIIEEKIYSGVLYTIIILSKFAPDLSDTRVQSKQVSLEQLIDSISTEDIIWKKDELKSEILEDYDRYLIHKPFNSVYMSWAHLSFIPHTIPRFRGINKLTHTQNRGFKRLYIFASKEGYHDAIQFIYRLLWLSKIYEADMSFMTNKLAFSDQVLGLGVIILDVKVSPGSNLGNLSELLGLLVNAGIGTKRLFARLHRPNMPDITPRLNFLEIKGEGEIGIASTEQLQFYGPIISGKPSIPLDIPLKGTMTDVNRSIDIDLLAPKRVGSLLKD